MIEQFKTYCQQQAFSEEGLSTLIATSGGVDSVVLCHLYKAGRMPFAIAHCNFQLRAEASDADEDFCRKLAQGLEVPFYSVRFDTEQVALQRKISIQVAARELRYEWLEALRAKQDYDYIATAHHMNDRIETFLYHFSKGSGIRGLRSIPARNGIVIRPLLFASKEMVQAYAKKQGLAFREDSSNATTKYTRNKIRLEVVPLLKSINPNLEATSLATFSHLEDMEKLLEWTVSHWRRLLVHEANGQTFINLEKLQDSPAPSTILYELLRPFGCQPDQINNILATTTQASGAQFYTPAYRLVTNRNQLVISALTKPENRQIIIEQGQTEVLCDELRLSLRWHEQLPAHFSKDKTRQQIAWLDASKLKFPLVLRKRQAGDFFQPLGMAGKRQKLKDYFINQKLSLIEKEQTWLLTSEEVICWVVGYRQDERFKIDTDSTSFLEIKIEATGE